MKDPRAFYRRKGDLEKYVEAATHQSDMLVWQSQQRRDGTSSLLNRLTVRPLAEGYDLTAAQSLTHTQRMATSPFLAQRHSTAQLRRQRFEVNDPLMGTLQRPNHNFFAAPQSSQSGKRLLTAASEASNNNNNNNNSLASSASTPQGAGGGGRCHHHPKGAALAKVVMHDKLLDFERKQHQMMNFQDWTKQELIELISAEGLEVPGEMFWDNDAGLMRKEICKKQVYVDYCKRKLFEAEPKPLVRRGKRLRLRESYCIVDIFKAAHGAVRVSAYDDSDSREYQMLLIPNKMHEMDLEAPPLSSEPLEWQEWSSHLVPRLELTTDGLLQVGEPPLSGNGLPSHFTLGASSSLSGKDLVAPVEQQQQQQRSASGVHTIDGQRVLESPDRMHVTLFFRSL